MNGSWSELMKSTSSRALCLFRRFRREERGSITIQVLIFSLLLLATTGIVLDSGRLYTQHSQLQAYTDQMALSAANELDGADDAIVRAAKSVFGIGGTAPYLRKAGIELGEFEVGNIAFYSAMAPSGKNQNDMTEAFPASAQVAVATFTAGDTEPTISYTDGDAVASSRAALFAVVQAREGATKAAIVGLTRAVLSIGNNGATASDGTTLPGPRPEFGDSYKFGAVAAASVEEQNCAEMSTLVFCNPWEDQDQSAFDLEPDDPEYSLRGRSLMYFAPNFSTPDGGHAVLNGNTEFDSAYDWDLNHQLCKLTGPLADEGSICSEANVPRLSEGEDYLVARDRCMMARAETDTICWGSNSDLTIEPAHGPDVSRAINTTFDIWMEPFASYIEDTAQIPGTGLGRHQFFEPDGLATTLFELADWYGAEGIGSEQDGDPAPEFEACLNAGPSCYDAYLGHLQPREDLMFIKDVYATGRGIDICHSSTYSAMNSSTPSDSILNAACDVDFVGDHYVGNGGTTSGARSEMQGYWQDMYAVDVWQIPGMTPQAAFRIALKCGTSLEQDDPAVGEFCALSNLSDLNVDTWYEVYKQERSILGDLAIAPDGSKSRVTNASTGGLWNNDTDDEDGDGVPNINYATRYGIAPDEGFIKQRPMDFMQITGETSLFSEARERRRLRSAMVNCTSTVANGPTSPGGNEYAVAFEDLRVLDVYLPHPASHFCGPFDPSCAVDASRETVLYMEVIEDVTDTATQRYVAKLVR